MDFTTKGIQGYAFLNMYVLVMRSESDALENLERTGDTDGAVRWRLPVGSHEPDTGGRRVSLLLRCVA